LRALIVDDTVLYRKILSDSLSAMAGIEVVGTAANGKIALDKIKQSPPDLVTLDFEMPVMDGLETLRQIHALYPKIRVLMVSSRSQAGAQVTLSALSLGAFDFVTKPAEGDWKASQESLKRQLEEKLMPLLRAQMKMPASPLAKPIASVASGLPKQGVSNQRIDIVAIGISTGGPKALAQMIPKLPGNLRVPVVIVQHMPAMFTSALAQSLNAQSALTVEEAQDGQSIRMGHVYLAPGGKQMRLARAGGLTQIEITDDPPENFCKPAVDYLFRSVADIYGARALGVIMTGMGADGTRGLQAMKAKGASSLAQDQATSVVYGMPHEAFKAGVVDAVLPLDKIANEIARICAR